jgi:DNA-binding transcriptional regulator YbjK
MLEILKYTIPSLIVLLSVWIVMHKLFKNEEQKRLWELKRAAQKEISPTRLRAYERLALLLERTQPEALIMALSERLEQAGTNLAEMSVQKMQQELLRTVRLEFDHNMSQQIYVSDEVWAKIIGARDQIGAFISAMALHLPPESTSMDYAKVLMTAYRNNGDTPHQLALDALKEEGRELVS